MSVLEELQWRGLVHQTTGEDLDQLLASQKIALYIGFDPTARSLHVGSLIPLICLKHFQRDGHRIVPLMGAGTGLIGDPSGKSEERNLQDPATIDANAAMIRAQVARFLQDPANPPVFRDNTEWLLKIGLLEFLRDTGKHFSVNAMIAKDSVKLRLEREGDGISFTEFTYSLLQARDFLELYRREGCVLQAGGSDQWGNIVAGVDLIRRVEGVKAHALTMPLLLNTDGRKFGKTERGSVFLDPTLTSPYAFYQFWFNQADADVGRLLRLFTFLERAEIEALESAIGSGARVAQRRLAEEVTRMIHGDEETDRAIRASEALFSGDIAGLPVALLEEIFSDVPALEIPAERVAGEGASLIDLLVETGACPSKGDARRQLQQGAIRLNGEAVAGDGEPRVGIDRFLEGRVLVLRRGKKNNHLVRIA